MLDLASKNTANPFISMGMLDNRLGSNVDPAYSTPLRKQILHILLRQMLHQSFSSVLLMSHKQMHDSLY